jgi:hypothetical protein
MRVTPWLAGLAIVALARADVPPAPTPLAASAQVSVTALRAPGSVTLHFARAGDHSALPVTQLAATLDGKPLSVTHAADDSWALATGGTALASGDLALTVSHDGIRELLTGTLGASAPSAPAAGSGSELLRDHKQLTWWILNIAIVLIAAIAISRRMS